MRDNGIEVTAFGVFTNLLDPDDGLRNKCIDSFVRCMDLAEYAGIKNLSTELGFRQEYRFPKAERKLYMARQQSERTRREYMHRSVRNRHDTVGEKAARFYRADK
jgi:sugar phosphate isomerase/epimerase